MSIEKKLFGKTKDGNDVFAFTITNNKKASVKVINYGATIVSINVFNQNGNLTDVELGFDTIEGYESQASYIGTILGRSANRIKNASYSINGSIYELTKNEGNNQLHGGISGFDRKIWDYNIIDDTLELSYLSVDGEEGYAGNLSVKATFSFDDNNKLKLQYDAVSDKDTVINLSHHCYFNLSGHDNGLITDHLLKLNCSYYTPFDSESIPTGEVLKVDNTPIDFREYTPINKYLNNDYYKYKNAGGYDQNFIIDNWDKTLRLASELMDNKSGIVMKTFTTMPGIQFYTGNYLNYTNCGKNGACYPKRSGLCLETQYSPNSANINHFASPIYKANEKYSQTTVYEFTTIK